MTIMIRKQQKTTLRDIKKPLSTLTCALLFGVCVNASGGEFYNAKTLGSAGVGVAGADFSNSALLNPALAAKPVDEGQNNRFQFNASVGILGSDKDDLVENLEELEDELDDIDDTIPSTGEVEDIVDLLNDIDGAQANFEFGSYFQASIPNDYLSLALFINLNSETDVSAAVAATDIAALNAAAGSATFDSDTIDSQVFVLAAGIAEYGVSLAKTINLSNQSRLTFGVSPKFQDIEIWDYIATVDNYDEDDFDNRSNRSTESHFNADVGIHYVINDALSLGAVIKNLNEETFTTEENRELELESRATLGFAYRAKRFSVEFNLDVDDAKEFVSQEKTQWLRVGTELDLVSWSRLRFGLRHDLEDNGTDLFTFGFGFLPGKRMEIDVAGMLGEDESYGALVQFGFRF